MKKLVYLIVLIVAFGLIVAGCLPVVPPTEQDETSDLMKGSFGTTIYVDDDNCPGPGTGTASDPFCTIQDAINDAASSGDTIIVADGIYTIIAAINVNKSVTIIGDIANPGNVLVKYVPASSTLNCVEVNSADVTIQGIKVQDCKNGFYFDKYVNTNIGVTISNCIIESVSGWGIGEISSPNTVISHNTITTAGDKGIYFRLCEGTSESNRCEAISNVISGCGQPAIQIYGGKYVYIYGNTISSTNDKGINIIKFGDTDETDRVQVISNTISGCPWPAIRTDAQATISGNQISGGDRYGIFVVNGATGSTVSGNTISNTSWEGIQSNVQVTITNNDISGGYHGIQLSNAASGSVIDGNNIHDNQHWGLSILSTVTDVTVQNNQLSYNGYGGVIVRGSGDGSGIHINFNGISGNVVYGVGSERTTFDVDAVNNWWGNASGPSGVGPGTGDAVSIYVDYDPWLGQDGFVTGGGWIYSPAGAYCAIPELEGKATFGFISKYKKGASAPVGHTQFNFQVADLKFHSDSYDWMHIAGPKAMYKGTGTINGTGDYGFMLFAIDGQINGGGDVDKFRIKIWDKDDGDETVYDNKIGDDEGEDFTATAIGGGQIVIHKGK